jgi:HK97 family phage prohead protease
MTIYFGKALSGYGVKYNTPYFHNGKYNCIQSGSFDDSLASGDTVRMLMEHDDALEFGDSKTNLILHSDDFGLAFRCHLRSDEISRHVVKLAESKAFLDCSIGFSYRASDTYTRTVSKTEVLFIRKAEIQEISFLRAGACSETSAVLEDADKCGALFEDCKSMRLVRDNKFNHLMRTLRDLKS